MNKALLKEVFLKVKRKFYYQQNLYSKSLAKHKKGVAKTLNNYFEVVKVDSSHLELLKEYAYLYRSANHFEKNIKSRIKNTNRFTGFAVIDKKEKKIAYLAWIDFKQIQLNDANFIKDLDISQAYFFDDHCVPEYRRKGLHKRIFEERLTFCTNKGLKEVIIAIMNDNKEAINNLRKFDFELVKSIKVIPVQNKLYNTCF